MKGRAAASWIWVQTFILATCLHEFSVAAQPSRPVPNPVESRRQVHFQGVALCFDPAWHQFYVHDGKDVFYYSPESFKSQPNPGDLVEITGTAPDGSDRAALTNLTVAIVGKGIYPRAKPLQISQMHREHGRWVEITGRLRMVDNSWGRQSLLVNDGTRTCLVYVLGAVGKPELSQFIGSEISVRGINASKVEGGQMVTAQLFAGSVNDVKIVEEVRTDLLRTPVLSIGGLFNRQLGAWTNQIVHLNGLVKTFEAGRSLILSDPTGVIRADLTQVTPVELETRVDLWGYLSVGARESILTDAYFEQAKAIGLQASETNAPSLGPASTKPGKILTRISDILKLRKEEAALHFPVRVEGVVLYADPEWRNGFIQDAQTSIYFDLNQKGVRSGQFVELSGETSPGGFAPEIIHSSIRILGTTNLPVPAKVELRDMASGRWDAQWIEMDGIVRTVAGQWGHYTLGLISGQGRFNAVIADESNPPVPTHLIDALVRVRGACSSELNAKGQVTGVTLHIPHFDQIEVLEPVPSDPFSVPATPTLSVARFDPARIAGRRVKVTGTVTLAITDKEFVLQDVTGGLRIQTQSTNSVHVGDVVEVLGFPAMGQYSPHLEEAYFRKTASGRTVLPRKTTAEEILVQGTNDACLVELEATLLQRVPRSANPQVVVQEGPLIFTAQFAGSGNASAAADLSAGSVVRLTGVCAIQATARHEPTNFRLILRSPADIQLLKQPPWWSTSHALWILSGLAGILLLSLAWVAALRSQVGQRTRELHLEIAGHRQAEVRLKAEIGERQRMQEQAEKTHRELLEVSRQAGMAEVATSVLHNVGNVLNSVNVSANLIMNRLKTSKTPNLAKAADLLKAHSNELGTYFSDDPKGKQLPGYFSNLAEHLIDEQTAFLDEMTLVTRNIEHIKEIVAMQQSYGHVSGVREDVAIADLVEDSLRIHAVSLNKRGLRVQREFEKVPVISIDKHKVLQILVNLIRNAEQACEGMKAGEGQLVLRVSADQDFIQVTVSDNGMGIAPENKTRIFSHGFTTRKNGHGFGLHSGALAAKEMGGSLSVHSEGTGLGATFTLSLPIRNTESVDPI